MKLPDISARLRVLTDLDATLLVEAAAGTGKTALMAGRLTMLLARGVDPRSIAAITFTELAASELSTRVRRYVQELLAGAMPEPLRPALPNGLSDAERAALATAATKLDDLTTATIHAFCQTIISGYAVEADIDPGARVMDAGQAEVIFDSIFEKWLKRRLGASAKPSDPIAALSQYDPRSIVETIKGLARFRLRYRAAHAIPADFSGRPDTDFIDALKEFRRWFASQPEEPQTNETLALLGELAVFYEGAFASVPDFAKLWSLAHPPRNNLMRGETSFELKPPRAPTEWQKIAGKDEGLRLAEEARARFDKVDHCYRALLGRVSTAVVAILSQEIDELLDEYKAFKRAAAALDFEDLLERARALVRGDEATRRALGERYQHILVDEFQDTDPIQSEILFAISAEELGAQWHQNVLRDGALFLVGDPKQAIYHFRGADISCYSLAKAAVERQRPGNIVAVRANFRSRPEILSHINRCFEGPLSGEGQPGYVPLSPTIATGGQDFPCVARITVDLPPASNAGAIRDAEAEAVAEVCARLIGNLHIRKADGLSEPLRAGGIALLAPTGTDLWRYERALEQRGLPIVSQAGKALYARQEVQDLLALARALADPTDTLAFGAFMRGPLVGLTEEELLDITVALSTSQGRPNELERFSVLTRAEDVGHPRARRALLLLQQLSRRARETTPALLLAEAVERFAIWPILTARQGDRSARAAANIEALIERARPYGVAGLKKFVQDVSREWRSRAARGEGRVDAEGDAIELITIHSSKGLEWPVVIPINTSTQMHSRERFVYRASDNTLHWVVGDVVPPELATALASDEESLARERERLWYVACTRARDLLVLPHLSQAAPRSWARIVNLDQQELAELDLSRFAVTVSQTLPADAPNTQTAQEFEAERSRIDQAAMPLLWVTPSAQDPDRRETIERVAIEPAETAEVEAPAGAGRMRGLVLHKLMEEVLTGELRDDSESIEARAGALLNAFPLDIDKPDGATRPDVSEMTSTLIRTLALPEIVEMRPSLVPEWPVYGMVPDAETSTAVSGRIDAIAFEDGRPATVLDWKSDVAPTDQDVQLHAMQIGDYLRATGATRGALVYMTQGVIRWVRREATADAALLGPEAESRRPPVNPSPTQ
jgi:ATP-dependent exoDNAse (exonuclease V) beta subunit